jgi:hypothetical protein
MSTVGMTLGQIESGIKATESIATHYGQGSFWLVGTIALLIVLSVILGRTIDRTWTKVIQPALQLLAEISKAFGTATSNIKSTTESQERMVASLANSLQRLEDHREQLKGMLDSIRGEGEGQEEEEAKDPRKREHR